jgi:excinuclease ABC subunit A
VLRVQLHFLPDMYVTCDTCDGKRYNRETLELSYRGLNIANALELTVDDASDVFANVPRIAQRLEGLRRIGLGYVRLGQPATTLSGGEAQRLKLASELWKRGTGRSLYILDEPTTGLHFSDVELLLVGLTQLRDAGNTVVFIEHNMDLVAHADWVIDLGPDGGPLGGNVVCAGPPERVAQSNESRTAAYLRRALDGSPPEPQTN